MHVPVFVPHPGYNDRSSRRSPTVINNTIIYQDTVLDLKNKGVNLNVTKIKVKISELEDCLNKIFADNLDVVFNTVQYSHKNEEAIFYTDKKISTEKWEKRNERTFEQIPKASTITEAIEQVFNSEDALNPEHISAFEVWLIYKGIDSNK